MVKWLVTILLPIMLMFIPEGDFCNYQVKAFLAVTVFSILLAAFELLPVAIIGLLLSGLYLGLKVAPVNVIMSPWSSTTLYMVLGGYALAGILDSSGILRRIAYKLMSKAGSNYMVLLFTIFFTGIVLTMLTFGRGYIILGSIMLRIMPQLGYYEYENVCRYCLGMYAWGDLRKDICLLRQYVCGDYRSSRRFVRWFFGNVFAGNWL